MPRVGFATKAVFGRRGQRPNAVSKFNQFRRHLFVDKLGWPLTVVDGQERDQFDRLDTEYCVVLRNDQVIAGFRAIRTDREYLALNVFPQLASTKSYPRSQTCWEISRFGIAPEAASSVCARLNYGLMFRFAVAREATSLVAVADLTYERYLRRLGIRTHRYGDPCTVGLDRFGNELLCVAGEIPITGQKPHRLNDLIDLTTELEIDDASLVLRPEAISA
jgi:N-acyl-L-homoserine lactone synthetase